MSSKVPPQNLEAEQSVLGGLMLDSESWDRVADVVCEDDFYKTSHQKIFAAIKDLNLKSEPVDILTVNNYLSAKNELDIIGGPSYLAEIIDSIPSAANISQYAKIVREKSILRNVIQTSTSLIEKAYNHEFESVDGFLDEVESSVFAVASQQRSQGLTPVQDIVRMSLEKIESLQDIKTEYTGVPSGFIDLDRMTKGFQPGELIILAARPSMGKTALSLNIATNASLKNKRTVAYFSLEMNQLSLMTRMLATEAKVGISDIRVGNIKDKDWPELIQAAASISDSKLFIDDTAAISPYEIRSKCRRIKAQHGLDMVIVDYLQIMDLKQKVESRERAVSEISKMLKVIAKEMNIPVIALAQLNRGVEGRTDRRPMVSDLRESGSIEQDADVIMMIYRDDYYDQNSEEKGIAEIIINKQRNGPTGRVKLKWVSQYGRFDNLAPGDLQPIPPDLSGSNGGSMGFNSGPQGTSPNGGSIPNFAPDFS